MILISIIYVTIELSTEESRVWLSGLGLEPKPGNPNFTDPEPGTKPDFFQM